MKARILFAFVLFSLLLSLFPFNSVIAQEPFPTPPLPPGAMPPPFITPDMPPRIMPPRPVPPPVPEIRYHRVDVKIEGQVALTKVEMLFVNSSSIMLEGTYLFPLPEEAAISSLVMYADGQKMVGEIMEKEKARQVYDSIVRQRRDPALLQYTGSRAVELRVFPLPPKGERKIQIEYSHFLNTDAGVIKYIYPLAGTSFPGSSIKELTITVQVKAREAVRNIHSPSHDVAIVRQSVRLAEVSYEAGNVTTLKDFALSYSLSEDEMSLNVITFKEGSKGYYLLLVTPRLDMPRSEIIARDVVLVLDVSGSMAGTKLEQAKEAVKNVLERLNPQDRFNIVSFHSSVSTYAADLRPASERAEALRYINDLRAQGSTNIYDALARAMDMTSGERPSVILLLTDGRPTVGVTDERGILALVRAARRDFLRLFTFGIGSDLDTNLLDSLAREGRGFSQYIRREDEIKTLVTAFYEKVSTPVLMNLKLDYGGIRVEEVYPDPVPDIYMGSQLIVVGRYLTEGETSIALRGRSALREERFIYEKVSFAPSPANSFIPALWARQKIGYLLEQIRQKGENKEVVDEIMALSQQYGIMTPYTSYFVKEDMPLPVPRPLPMPLGGAAGGPMLAGGAAPEASARRGSASPAGPPGPAGPGGPTGKAIQSGGQAADSGYTVTVPQPTAASQPTPVPQVTGGIPTATPSPGAPQGGIDGENPDAAGKVATSTHMPDGNGKEKDKGNGNWLQRIWSWLVGLFRK